MGYNVYMQNETINIILAVYVFLFLLSIAFLAIRVKKQTGIFPIVKNKEGVYGFVDKIVLLSYFLIIVNVVAYILGEVPINESLDVIPIKIMGLVIVSMALLFMFISQVQMGKNWRIGIDQKNKTDIVQNGFFRYLRHPIYLFAIFLALGIAFIIPWVVSLCLFYILWVALSIQARIEEEFLLQNNGQKYKDFMKTRKRWFS